MSSEKRLIVIGGATASGKTSLAIVLARQLNTEIISADSRQFFRELNIGTAKPTAEELAQAPHHFIGHLSITEEYSVGAFERDALALLEQLFKKHDWVVMVGGSGLYIKAVCEGLDDFPAVPRSMRDQVQGEYDGKGLSPLLAELATNDPTYFQQVDQANPARIIRAISFIRTHQQPFSNFHGRPKPTRPFTPIYLMPDWPRTDLYQRINERVDQMMKQGLLEEARQLLPQAQLNALQTVGYQELMAHFQGDMTLEEAVALIKQNSRRYAKRQLTWLRRDAHWRRIWKGNSDLAINFIALLQKGWKWQTTKQTYGFQDINGQAVINLKWLEWHQKRMAIIQGEIQDGQELLDQLLDQLTALANERDYLLCALESNAKILLPLDYKKVSRPEWTVHFTEIPIEDGMAFFQPSIKAS